MEQSKDKASAPNDRLEEIVETIMAAGQFGGSKSSCMQLIEDYALSLQSAAPLDKEEIRLWVKRQYNSDTVEDSYTINEVISLIRDFVIQLQSSAPLQDKQPIDYIKELEAMQKEIDILVENNNRLKDRCESLELSAAPLQEDKETK